MSWKSVMASARTWCRRLRDGRKIVLDSRLLVADLSRSVMELSYEDSEVMVQDAASKQRGRHVFSCLKLSMTYHNAKHNSLR